MHQNIVHVSIILDFSFDNMAEVVFQLCTDIMQWLYLTDSSGYVGLI